jgi:hypothetical protein
MDEAWAMLITRLTIYTPMKAHTGAKPLPGATFRTTTDLPIT